MSSKNKVRPLPQSLEMPFTGADSHAHLDDEKLLPQLPEVLKRAVESGVAFIVHMFLQHKRYAMNRQKILDAALSLPRSPEICFARGLHPEDVSGADEEEWEHLEDVVRYDPLIRAVGEIGLDYHYEEGYSPSGLQEQWFRRQLHLARQLGKPVIIHSRDAWDDTLRILDEENMQGYPLLWHCFGENADRARQVIERGWHIALGGAATFRANTCIREALKAIPLDRLLFETDCPYLAPEPWRGKINEPALSVFTAAAMARELDMNPSELWTLAGENARRFFGLC